MVLGPTGKNFAAGMSGGIAYVLDEKHDLYMRVNKELVAMEMVEEEEDIQELYSLIEEHTAVTHSPLGRRILENFETYRLQFKKVVPRDYKKIMQTIREMRGQGQSEEEAALSAFYAVTKR